MPHTHTSWTHAQPIFRRDHSVFVLLWLFLHVQSPQAPASQCRGCSTCPLTTGAGINSCVVDAKCPEGLIPLTCSCRISQRTDDAYWMLDSQFTTGSSVNVDGDSTLFLLVDQFAGRQLYCVPSIDHSQLCATLDCSWALRWMLIS